MQSKNHCNNSERVRGENIRFFALGGANENGKNCFVIEIDNNIFVINAGSMVPLNTSLGVDAVIPKVDYLFKNLRRVKAIFITDVKSDSYSALPWFLKQLGKIPVYASKFSLSVIKDTLLKYNFLEDEYDLRELKMLQKIGNVTIKSFQIAGGLPQQKGIGFKTKRGYFVFILNSFIGKTFAATNLKTISEEVFNDSRVATLFLDSGNALKVGKTSDFTYITDKIERFFKKRSWKRIIFSCFEEDLFTINEVAKLAIKYGRKIFVYGKMVRKMQKWAWENQEDNFFKNIMALSECEIEQENSLVFVTSSVDKLFVRLRRIAEKQDIILKPNQGDLLINVATPINGLEVYSTHTLDIISAVVGRLVDLQHLNSYRFRAARDDIENFIKTLKPLYFLPIQGLYRYMFKAMEVANLAGVNRQNIPIVNNGKIVVWNGKRMFLEKEVIKDVGNIYLDNVGYSLVNDRTLKERERLSKNGVVTITGLISASSKKLLSDIKVKFSGVFIGQQRIHIIDICKKSVVTALKEFGPNCTNYKNIQRMKNGIKRKIQRIYEKEPVIIINLYQIIKN